MKNIFSKKGMSIIVTVVFALIIASVGIIMSMIVTNVVDVAKQKAPAHIEVNEQNAMQDIELPTVIDFSASYIVEDDVAVIQIQDNSSNIVMFTCMKVYDGVTPNVADADFEYSNIFVAPDSGEYLIYAKDVKGNISDAVVLNVEI